MPSLGGAALNVWPQDAALNVWPKDRKFGRGPR
jgi:hypothetical protein